MGEVGRLRQVPKIRQSWDSNCASFSYSVNIDKYLFHARPWDPGLHSQVFPGWW